MRLVSFSVENFRSITRARKVPLSNYSVLVGANNEGKSNILQALALGMNALIGMRVEYRQSASGRTVRRPVSRAGSLHTRHREDRLRYNWDADFPVGKQPKAKPSSATKITLEFELNEDEVRSFKTFVGSNLNGTLPLQVSLSRDRPTISVRKQGVGQSTLNRKGARIAQFVSERIQFEYIPSIRTAESASHIIRQMVAEELRPLQDEPKYKSLLAKIDALRRPTLSSLEDAIKQTVTTFLPSVKSVNIDIEGSATYRDSYYGIDVVVDDGNETRLERKGDGVQSLVALALMRHVSEARVSNISTVIAIEEPEAHLHPRAIRELRAVLQALSGRNQVVLTSHSPLFVNPNSLGSTIIVKSSRAIPKPRIADVRRELGVQLSDNLRNADLVVLVEGNSDETALRSLLAHRSLILGEALTNGTVYIDNMDGVKNLSHRVSFYRSNACGVHCFLDNDAATLEAAKCATQDKLLSPTDITLCTVPGFKESEIEDLYDKCVYGSSFHDKFGVDPSWTSKRKGRYKWSKHIRNLFKDTSSYMDEKMVTKMKQWLAQFAADNPDTIVNRHHADALKELSNAIERRLDVDAQRSSDAN